MDPVAIPDRDFHELVVKRAQTLLGVAGYVAGCRSGSKILVRPLLGELLSLSMQFEEFLDAYDARNNCKWCSLRSLSAALKLFSDVGYELLHIQHAFPAYRLPPIKQDFAKATEQALLFTGDVLLRASRQLVAKAKQLDLRMPEQIPDDDVFAERLPPGRLPHYCVTHKIDTVSETVSLLSTAFLNLAAESENVHAAVRVRPEEYVSFVANSATEEGLRSLQLRFHNLQSMYDTYVSGTEAESADEDLHALRGHISVVLHLLKTATSFAHYYERHVRNRKCDLPGRPAPLITSEELLAMLMNYSLLYGSSYINCGERLCQGMLKRYIEIAQIEAPVPQYRGFHVRPSTLISKLVLHYGSDVRMELDGETYDAGLPLDLFRANEKINAQKRRWLAAEIVRLKLVPENVTDGDVKNIIRGVIMTMAERGKVILYKQPLEISNESVRKEGTLLEQTADEIARLLATGEIDIDAGDDLKVKFIGDKRVLADIALLARWGYGEDKLGNNISLPKELAYLRI
jgi:hypothetical protein